MNNFNVTSLVYLLFTLIVGIGNAIIGRYEYLLFALPFFLSYIVEGFSGKIFEVVGLLFTAFYLMIAQDFSIGMIIMITASCLVFTTISDNKKINIFMAFISILIFLISFMNADGVKNKIIHAFLDCALYAFGSLSLKIMLINRIKNEQLKNQSVDQKYLNVIDELHDLAHESINQLKILQKEVDDERSRKNC